MNREVAGWLSHLISAPTAGLLTVWGDLVEALHGVSGFGGRTAEIYAYRLEARDPTIGPDNTNIQPAQSLIALCWIFVEHYECRLEIEGTPILKVQAPQLATLHRWRVGVNTGEELLDAARRGSAPDLAALLIKFGRCRPSCESKTRDATCPCTCGWADLRLVVKRLAYPQL